jgi:hypothetical protein
MQHTTVLRGEVTFDQCLRIASMCKAHLLDAPKAADEPPSDDGLHAEPGEVACAGQGMAAGLSACLWCPVRR